MHLWMMFHFVEQFINHSLSIFLLFPTSRFALDIEKSLTNWGRLLEIFSIQNDENLSTEEIAPPVRVVGGIIMI